jgi:hypothetical protein
VALANVHYIVELADANDGSTDVPVPVDACNTLSVRLWNDQQPARYYYGSFASLFGESCRRAARSRVRLQFTHVYLFTLFFVREVIIKMEGYG